MDKYYEKIKHEKPDYEEAYWAIIKDPDGKIRNRLEEKNKFLANLKYELNFINTLKPSKILEIGCGPGFLLSAIDKKHRVSGLEISKLAAEHAKQFAPICNVPLEEARLEENSFDAVISHHVIEHVENPESFLSEIKKILKPEGLLILATPDFKSVCAKLFKKNYRMLFDKTHINLFSFTSLKKMLTDYGFDITEVDFPYFETEYFTENNILKMLNYKNTEISPACWGNFMTFYCINKK